MKFKVGDNIIVNSGSVLTFKDDYKYDYSGCKGTVIGFNNDKDGYVVKFDKRTLSSFPDTHVKFIKDNYSYDDRVIFYDNHLSIYIKNWKDNLKDTWCV
jgi:hypothetical protein